MTLPLAIILGWLVLTAAVGVLAGLNRKFGLEEFMVGGRSFGTLLFYTIAAAEIYSALGFVMARLGKPEAALADYRKALELDPKCASAHANLAVAFVQAGKLDDAESHYRQALAGKPTAATHNGLAYVLARQGRTDEAVAEYRKAIDLDAGFTPAYNNLAGTLARQGKLEEAEHYYRLSLAQKPSPAVRSALDGVLRQSGKADEAAKQSGKSQALSR